MSLPAYTQLRQLQKSLYDKAFAEAHEIVDGTSLSIVSYSRKFQQSLPADFRRSTLAELTSGMRQHRFVLYGDFHTLRQSQRGLLRLLRSHTEQRRNNKVVLALEMFKAIDQDFIDAYLGGQMAEDTFLEQVNYATEWGFPWQNFKMILDFARKQQLPVIGINTDNAGRDTLLTRDRYAAKRLVDAAEKYPRHKIVCLIGEYHLADEHLPKSLAAELRRRRQPVSMLRILNNVDHYYFELPPGATNHSSEYLWLKPDFFCIMNSPPWMKWQSFSLWEEMRHLHAVVPLPYEKDLDADLDLYHEDAFDIDYQFLSFVKNLVGFLGLKVDDSGLESFHLHYAPGGDFYKVLTSDAQIDPAEAERIIKRASTDGVYFLPKTNSVLLTEISINNLADATGQFLHTLLTGHDDTTMRPAEDFHRRVLKAALGMISSKILNPRRKSMELHHYRQFVRRHKGQRLTGQASARRLTAQGVLQFDKWMQARLLEPRGGAPLTPKGLVLLDRRTNYQVSRAVGQMLGFALYKKVLANKEPSTRIRQLFQRRLRTIDGVWKEVLALYELVAQV